MAVAIPTFSDSDVGVPIGYDGMSNFPVTRRLISSEIPLPSLPITMNPACDNGVS